MQTSHVDGHVVLRYKRWSVRILTHGNEFVSSVVVTDNVFAATAGVGAVEVVVVAVVEARAGILGALLQWKR